MYFHVKILFRYFQIWMPVLLIVFIKKMWEYDDAYYRFIFWTGIAGLAGSLVYYLFRGTTARQAIMDGHLYLILENISKLILPHADAVITGVIALGFISHLFLRKFVSPKTKIWIGIAGVTIGFWLLTLIQLPVYTNIYVKGTEIEKDGIEIAKYAQKQ